MAKEEDACVAGVAYFNGRRILQWSKRCYAHSSLRAEAFALIIAAQLAQTMNWSSILFPSDANFLFLLFTGHHPLHGTVFVIIPVNFLILLAAFVNVHVNG